VALLALVALLAVPQTGFAYGRTGGSIRPFAVTISTTGAVRASGAAPENLVGHLTKQQLADLNRIAFETRFALLPARTACPGALPDVADQYIRVGSRVARVHGACVKRFNRFWAALGDATT
jgi:hypothetical protein